MDRGLGDQEKFFKVLQEVEETNEEYMNVQAYYDSTIQDMKSKLEEKEAKANEIKEAFLEFKREIAKDSVHSKTGKGIYGTVRADQMM